MIDLTEHNDSGESGLRIVWNGRVEDEATDCGIRLPLRILEVERKGIDILHAHVAAMLGRHVLVGLCNQHVRDLNEDLKGELSMSDAP